MIIERKMIHDIVELIPESEITKIYAIINAYLSFDNEDVLTDEQKQRMRAGFDQITRGEYVTINEYMKKRGLPISQ